MNIREGRGDVLEGKGGRHTGGARHSQAPLRPVGALEGTQRRVV